MVSHLEFRHARPISRPCGPMDKASVYGTGDSRFESWQGHFFKPLPYDCITMRAGKCETAHGVSELRGVRSSRGVTVSTLDSDSSDGGSNPFGSFFGGLQMYEALLPGRLSDLF